jgi:hypothetical protein
VTNIRKSGLKFAGAIFSILILAAAFWLPLNEPAQAHERDDFEVWLVDQSNTNGLTYGGTIYVYDGRDLTDRNPSDAVPTDVINLGGETAQLCFNQTGANPVRPHMINFNSTETHAVLSFVASGHVVFFNARSREPVACFRTEIGAGGARQAHAAWITTEDHAVLVANQNGKKLERIRADFRQGIFTQEPLATLDLANCVTPNGLPCQDAMLRPDNAPICPFTASNDGPAFVSLRGGGMFVVDWRQTPMRIVAEYDKQNVPPNGCGFIEARGKVWGNGGGGTAANLDGFAVYRVPMTGFSPINPPNTPAAQMLFNDESHDRDAHGVAVTKNEHFVWMGDRDANVAEVFHAPSGYRLWTVNLVSPFSADPTPDLIAASPDRKWFFMSTRGPNPLSGDPHSSTGSTPGLMIVRLKFGGLSGEVKGLVRISNIDAGGIERADAHGIRMRRKHY